MDVEKKSNAVQQPAVTATTGANAPDKMETEKETKKKDLMKLVVDDPWLEPHNDKIKWRYQRFEELKNEIEKVEGSLDAFSSAYQDKFGFIKRPDGVIYREWAPGAAEVTLTGDFSASAISFLSFILCHFYSFYSHFYLFWSFKTSSLGAAYQRPLHGHATDGWNRDSHKMQKDEHGVWSVFVPNAPDGVAIPHGSKVKVSDARDASMCP